MSEKTAVPGGEFECWVKVASEASGGKEQLVVEGWVFSREDDPIQAVRAIAYDQRWPGKYGFARPDVCLAFPALQQAQRCGFRISLPSLVPDAALQVEATTRGDWQTFFTSGSALGRRLNWWAYAVERARARINDSRQVPPDRYEGLEQGYICWIDQPANWGRVDTRFQILGWCFSQDGQPIDGIRAVIGSQNFGGRYGSERPDVAKFFGERPGTLKTGFEVEVEAQPGVTSYLRLEARQSDGEWREVFRKSLRVGRADGRSYQSWIRRYDSPGRRERLMMRRQIAQMKKLPRFAIVIAKGNSDSKQLARSVRSVRAQVYPHWKLRLNPESRVDQHIKTSEHGRIEDADFLVFLRAGELLAPTSLYLVAREVCAHPDVQVIYGDEDELGDDGRRVGPHFKPDWNWALLLENDYVSDSCIFRTELVKELGYQADLDSLDQYELLLRCAEKVRPQQIRHIPHVLYHRRPDADQRPSGDATSAVRDHLKRLGRDAEVVPREGGLRRVRYVCPKDPPTVSIIIPTRDMVHLLRPCLESMLDKTSYPRFEIVVVDNGSREPGALQYLGEVARDPRVRVLWRDEEFNYSRLTNCGVQNCDGEFVALVNNDVIAIHPDWLEELVAQALQPKVGAVGPRLLYPDGRIQQAGVILGAGVHGVAEVTHRGLARGERGYASRADVAQELSAVGAACLVVRRSIYLEAGGFDETNLKVGFNDIDFCLELRTRGYRIVYTPYAELFHLEHASRGWENTPSKNERFRQEIEYMKAKWKEQLRYDPFYNRNLSLDRELFTLAFPPRPDLSSL
ncbi:MAG: glycosyltransferase family 2 protein [Spartobacteria bacterium]